MAGLIRQAVERHARSLPVVDVLLVLTLLAALVLAFLRGPEHSMTAIAILLSAVAANRGGLLASVLITPAVMLPLHMFVVSAHSWERLGWDLVVALVVAALVADLRSRYRRTKSEAQSTRSALREGQRLMQRTRTRLARYRQRLHRRGQDHTFLAMRQARLLAEAPLRWLDDADYASIYERIAHATLGVLGDVCRVDLWEADGRHADRFYTATRERIPELDSFLTERRGIDRLPEIRALLRHQRARVIEPVSDHTWAALMRRPVETLPARPAGILLVPIVINGRVRASITVCRCHARQRYSADTIARAEEFARHAGIVIVQLLRLEHVIAARHRAEQAEETKSDALVGFSHDMRTPLQAVNGYTQLLLEQIAGPLTLKQREYLMRIQQAQERMAGFVDRVLALARLDNESGQGPRAVELSAVARDVSALFAVECQHKRLQLELPDDRDRVIVKADPEKVWRVMQNLISNAVKYTPAGGHISLSFKRAHDRVELQVSDNGKGVPNQELDAIFRPFYQVDPHAEGSGLGLAISRTLAHEMGGDLEVASELGRGSIFTLRLPRLEDTVPEPDARPQESMLMASAV